MTTLDDIDRLYGSIPIPLRAKRILRDIENGTRTRAGLYRLHSKRRLAPSPSEINYLVSYLIWRELLRTVPKGAEDMLYLVEPVMRSDRARTFDDGERTAIRRKQYAEDHNRNHHTPRRKR